MGYSGPAALMDIIDNCIEAEATRVDLYFEQNMDLKTKSRLEKIVILDDGNGMNLDEMYNALLLGSPDSEDNYSEFSLSKFGYGLKSAGFSIAKNISLISRKTNLDDWKKSYISYDDIISTNEWNVFEDEELTENDKLYVEKISKGTIVILSGMQPIFTDKKKDTFIKHIRKAVALTFGSLLDKTEIYVEDILVEKDDPLFWKDAKKCIEEYDGSEPCRFIANEKNAPIGIANINGKKVVVSAKIKAVQLPNLHAFTNAEWTKSGGIKDKYRMTSEREGIYIYRNNRLISEHTTLGFFNKNDTDFMSLRIRIDVDSSADELVSLDVKKKTIQFSDNAMKEIGDIIKPIIKQSRELWNMMKSKDEAKTSPLSGEDERHKRSNDELKNKFGSVTNPEDNSVVNVSVPEENLPETEKKYGISESLLKELNEKNVSKISNVSYLDKNMLWAPAYSSSLGTVVLLSRQHPFYDRIYSKLEPGCDEVVILDALFLALASAEQNILLLDKDKEELFVKLFKKMRATVSQNLEIFLDFDFEEEDYE